MKKNYSVIRTLERISYYRIWLIIFSYSLIIGLLVQFFIIPNIFFKMHAGNGLIIGGDWVGYHEIAKNLAYKINSYGWQLWELRPYGQSAAGITAAIYALTISKPFILLPFYSAIMASSALILIRITEELVKNRFAAIISIIPFMIFPSNILIYNQIGKDAIYFLGAYFCIYSWILVFSNNIHKNKYLISIIFFLIGSLLMWLVRNYSIIILKNMLYIFIFLIINIIIINFIKYNTISKKLFGLIILMISLSVLNFYKLDKSDARGTVEIQADTKAGLDKSDARGTVEIQADTKAGLDKSDARGTDKFTIQESNNKDWHGLMFARDIWVKSDWLPNYIDIALLNIAILRNGYILDYTERPEIYKNTGSMIDLDQRLISAGEFLKYAPRALQIALLAPFPNDWVRDFKSVNGQRGIQLVIAIEMLVSYVCLLMLPLAIFSFWKNPYFYVPVTFSMVMLMLYAYSTPNIGTLHRLRYGFTIPLITISLGYVVSKFVNQYKLRLLTHGVER